MHGSTERHWLPGEGGPESAGGGWLDRLLRSISLMWVFVAISAAVLAAGALLLGSILTSAVRDQAIEDAEASLTQFVDAVLAPHLVENDEVVVHRELEPLLVREVAARPDILTVKVWRGDGVVAWTNRAQERIGQRFPVSGHLAEAIREGKSEAEFDELGQREDAAEAEAARSRGLDHVLEVYAPVRVSAGAAPVGAYEIYADSRAVEHRIADRQRLIRLVTGAVFLVLFVAFVLLVRGASSTLRRQTRMLRNRSAALAEAYERLEASSLEAIEGLNATVEAKDPYTAGHSRRVQEIALEVGRELAVAGPALEDLRLGALFHDIGKIAVPDAILTKPERLDAEEYEQIKEHSAAGAKILGKLASLRGTVPIIRHHHERWDGSGYPDGLAGDEIPLGAAITGLADAWDAMTTDRPYHRALTAEEALSEIERGRGTQFSPVVVDAWLVVLRRRPELLEGQPDDALTV